MKSDSLPKILTEAKAHLKANQWQEAKLRCLKIIEKFPLNASANYLLVKIDTQLKQFSHAFECLQRAYKGDLAEKFNADIAYEFQDALISAHEFELLEKVALWLSACRPKDPFSWDYLSISRIEQDRFEEALDPAQRALALMPQNSRIFGNLGAAYNGLKNYEKAENYLKRAIELEPGLANAHNNMGNALFGLGKNKESITYYLNAILLDPNIPYFHTNLAVSYQKEKQLDKAEAHFRKALELQPDNALSYICLLEILVTNRQDKDAVLLAQTAIQVCATSSKVWAGYGNVLQRVNQLDGAIEAYMKALSLEKDPQSDFSRKIYSSLLFVLNNHPDLPAEVIYGGYEEFNQRFGLPFHSTWTRFDNVKDPDRRLRVGYISQAFYNQVCKFHLLPLMERHDHTQLEVFAYSDPPKEDEDTLRYKATVDCWVDTKGMSDEALAERIKSDKIDILVDISGHSSDNRLGVMARKPAPVSLHWLDFGYTTGLTAIDYYLTDRHIANTNCDHLFSEKLWCLENTSIVYRPAGVAQDLTESPFLKDGIITFGTLSRSNRITHKVVRVWSAILDAMPNSRLVINSSDFGDPQIQDEVAARFMQHGIERSRLDIGYSSPSWLPLQKIDIGLDCFPHNSGTTLIETLFMGIPFVTLADRPSVGRIGSSILGAAGHPEWIAHSEMEYAEKVLTLAHDTELLQHLRKNMRAELIKSPLMDEKLFAHDVENAYRQMWKIYCEKESV
ncbi:tetratricopeptide repeat protein [Undibacterium sp. Ji67W]|uniref:O-linked N-acetylglucosamine transferase, SPINDLY family protein n=1 Tax=Undibacterium sp. Ji67W TaxID=3413042 RepID=UPI003BF15AAA